MLINFIEANPVPVKSAMAAMGLLEESLSTADVPADDPNRRRSILGVLEELDLLKKALA